jgi:PncC family amidohydrolase
MAMEGLAGQLGALLLQRQQTVTAAESCTGGLICGAMTDIAGSSAWFGRGFVAYANQAKTEMLAVPPLLLQTHGAVSESVVLAMAAGARAAAAADWAVAVSGIAGPGGGSPENKDDNGYFIPPYNYDGQHNVDNIPYYARNISYFWDPDGVGDLGLKTGYRGNAHRLWCSWNGRRLR